MDRDNYTLVYLLLFFAAVTITSQSEQKKSNNDDHSNDSVVPVTVASNSSEAAVENPTEILEDVITLTISSKEDFCLMTADPGPCTAEEIRFFYDSQTLRCRQFIYSGCGGNNNQFKTEAECLETCISNKSFDNHPLNQEGQSNENDISGKLLLNGDGSILTLENGNGETSFTFAAEYPFIQLKAVDISDFQLRYF
jgi:hypothetical protein